MSKIYSLLLIILLFNQIQSMHLKHLFSNSWHFQTEEEKQAYLNQLIKIEDELNSSIKNLKPQVESYNQKIQKNSGSPALQRQMYEAVMKDERSQIYLMQNQLSLPLNSKVGGCQNLTKEEAESVNQQVVETQKQIHVLEEKLKNQPQCAVTDETQTQIQFLKIYVNHLSEELENLCEKPDSFKNFYLPYPKSNYTYGSQGEQGFKNKIQSALDQGSKTLNCPKDKPYPQNGQCITCEEGAIYDLTQQKCIKCADGQIYNSQLHKCNIVFNSNPGAGNYQGTPPIAIAGGKTCQDEKPFFNGNECISCSLPSYFNFKTNVCETCTDNLVFSIVTQLCGFKPKNINSGGQNICCGTIIANPDSETCPKQTPYYNGKQCINCVLPQYFSLKDYRCTFCPDGEGFSVKQHKCINQEYLKEIINSTINEDIQNYKGQLPIIGQQYENIVNCDVQTPYSDGDSCQSCKLPSYFNFQSLKCEICDEEYKFSIEYHKCVHMSTEKFNSNMASINNFVGPIIPFNPDLQTCPQDKPYFNGHQCVSCQIPQFVDFSAGKCRECESNFIFNLFNRECVTSNPISYTNLNSENIYYNGNFKTVENQIENTKSMNPQATQCSIDTPFFNFLKNSCQNCSGDLPLFDYKYNKCTKCPNNSQFNNQNHRCLSPGGVFPTLQRMMMNTVGIL